VIVTSSLHGVEIIGDISSRSIDASVTHFAGVEGTLPECTLHCHPFGRPPGHTELQSHAFEPHTRAFELHTRAFELHTRAFELHTRAFELHTRAFELHTRAFEVHTRVFELHTRVIEHHTRVIELHTRVIELHARVIELHTRVIELHSRAFELHTRVIELHSRAFELHSRAFELHSRAFELHLPAHELHSHSREPHPQTCERQAHPSTLRARTDRIDEDHDLDQARASIERRVHDFLPALHEVRRGSATTLIDTASTPPELTIRRFWMLGAVESVTRGATGIVSGGGLWQSISRRMGST
jgi:putative membrane protein